MKLSSFLAVLTVILIGLKLFAGLAISWLWCLMPLILLGVWLVLMLTILIIMLLFARDALMEKVKEELRNDRD